MGNRYIVMTSSAQMPSTVMASYRNVAVVETDGEVPKFIGTRARHTVRIVESWRNCHYGRNPKGNTAYERALRDATALAAKLNQENQEVVNHVAKPKASKTNN
jgi:hypothetical protein